MKSTVTTLTEYIDFEFYSSLGLIMRKPSSGFANNKGADQPAHLHSLISAFIICLS